MTILQRHLASPGQQALWTFHRLNPASPAYNMVLARELRAELDPDRLCAAFALVVANYEALHCGYHEDDSQLWMIQPARIEADVVTQRVKNLTETGVRAWLEHQADLPFDLERAQVCRLRLLHNQTDSGSQLHMCAVFHHISGDFFSVEWAVESMLAVYEALENGQPLPLPEPGLYFDWLTEQREMHSGETSDTLTRYWKERLADAPAPLELTPDLPRPRIPSYTGEEFEQWLSVEDSAALRALAEQLNISLFALLAGLFQVFMHRQTDQDDFLIGTPTMDRHKAKYKQLVGYTLNAVPLRARLKDNPRLEDCLRESAKQLREGLRHRRLPLARIQEAAGSAGLFRHMLTYMPNRREAALERFSLREHLATQRGAANELNLRWQDDGQQLQAQWRYSTEVFRAERIARMAGQFVEFAHAAMRNPQARLSDLPVCPSQSHSRLSGPALTPSADTALAAFAQQVAAHPQRLALVEGEACLSYAELDQTTNRLAGRFQAAGLRAGGVVALALPRGTALLSAMLASWKAGAAYLCLDPALPLARRQHMLADSGALLVIGQGPAPAEIGRCTWLDIGAMADVKPVAANAYTNHAHPAQPAYLIYTSGSTGAPKGVVVTQGNLIHYVDGVLRALQLPDNASLTALATVAADLGYTAWFGALLSGRSLRLIDEALASDPEALAASLATQPVDCLKIVPSHLKALLAVAEPERLLPRHCLVLGGEGLDLALAQRLRELAPGCRIVNHYGPTETTVGCLSHGLENVAPNLSGYAPVGAPLANVSVQVLDRYLEPLPQGAAGELYVGGAGVASGYLGQPRLSAERFIPNPFAADGSRLYRTGDRARLLPGGLVEFLGRIDNQVKIRGFRVELGEIEACLKAYADLRDAVVLAQPAANGEGQRLIAYLVPAKPIQQDALRQQLAKQLPDYMLPSAFVELAELPRLANGKVDRQNLPQPAEAQCEQAAGGAPRDAVEATLVELWSALLERESVSIHDDFFALGGDSILALQLIAKARQAGLKFSPKQLFAQPTIATLAATLDSPVRQLEAQLLLLWRDVLEQPELGRLDDFFALGGDSILALQLIAKARQAGLKFNPKELFEHPRVEALAALLLTRAAPPATAPAAPAKALALAPFALSPLSAQHLRELAGAELEDAYPLSPLQKGLLFHSLLEGDSGVYVNQLQAELNGPLDPQRFIGAWRAAVAAHPLLRTGVLWQGLDEPLQCVHRTLELPVCQLDWREQDDDARREALDLFCRDDRRQGFAPDRPPLQRLALMQLGAERWWLVWSRHNLIADGWSSLALLQEVLARYAGETPPPRPVYREYIGWLAARPAQASAPFWAQQLAGFEGAGSLPLLAAPRPGQALDYLTQALRFDTDDSSRLNAAARRLSVTLNTLIQAAWGLLLARYNDQPDVVFGAISSGRPSELPGAERMLGVFINTLPLRVQALPQLSVQAYVQAVQAAGVALREHEQTPLGEILQASPRGAALFDTLLVFQNLPEIGERRLHAGGLSLQALDNLEQTTYGLTVKAQPGRELELLFSAAAQRLPAPALQALTGHFRELLLALAEDGTRCLGELPLLAAAERDALLRQWNQSARPLAPGEDMLSLFERQAQAAPQRQALVCGAEQLSYGELNAQANRLARWLRQAGVGCDQLVAVSLEREAATLVTLLAIHKAGGAYLPIDPAQPPARNADILEQAQPSLLLTREALRGGFAAGLRLVTLEALKSELALQDSHDLGLPVHPRQLAYSLYTSGSTGRPKGVQIERQAFVNFLHGIQEYARLGAADRLLAVTTLGFDIAGLELFLPLVQGACVVLATREQVLQPTELLRLLEQEAITLMQATPASWQVLVEHDSPAWQGLRVLCGGEALGAELAQRLLGLGVELTNVYGPTETTVWSAAQPVQRVEAAVVPIGRPLANNRLYILDARLEPQPPGVVGELYIGGAGLARGYASRPELTAAAFVPNPFAEAGAPGAEAGSRLYRTGDLARYRADGSVEFLGRRDFQVKLRGFRIELGEIEACLERHPAVQKALVSLQRLGETELLVAYWQGRVGVSNAALAEQLRAELPAYMVPSAWVRLEQWPLNANGKVDRQALPAPQLAEQATLEPLQSDTEWQLAALWEALLPPQPLGRQSHFFEAGGHSLLATRLLARLRQTLAVELPLRALLEAPQLWRMAERIDDWRASNTLSVMPVLQPVARRERMPLSLSQQRLWLVNRLQGPSAAYSMAATLSLRGELNVPALEATFAALLERHEVLRTAYPEIDGEPWAVIDAQANISLPCRDLSALPRAEREAEAARDSLEHLRQPFDLSQAPLLRAGLLKLADDHHLLHLALHHMVADGWSVGVLINEFSHLYSRLSLGQPADLPALPVQYADYALWQRQLLSGERLDAELAFWRTALAGAPQVLPLPTDHPRPTQADSSGATHSFQVPAALVKRLDALAQSQNASLYMVLLAAFQVLLHRITGSRDLLLGTDVAGREAAELEGLIGFFVNVLPLRSQLREGARFVDLLEQTKQTSLSAFEHQALPFDRIVEALDVPRERSRNPLVQALFVLQNTPEGRFTIPGLEVELLPPAERSSKFDMALFLETHEQGLRGNWVYASALFKAERIAALAADWLAILEQAASAPETLLELPTLRKEPAVMGKTPGLNAKLDKLKKLAPRTSAAPRPLIKTTPLMADRDFPLLIEPAVADLDPVGWARSSRDLIDTLLCRHAGLLFRGFALNSVQDFEAFAEAIHPGLFGGYGDLPKKEGGRNIYRSTPYPEREMILYHNESSHLPRAPRKQWFFCEQPSPVGGATPIVDCRELYRRLPQALAETFERKGLLYVRTFTKRLDVSWQEFFKTDDRAEVEAQCRASDTEFVWLANDELQTRTRCPAVIRHPLSGERSFFNQVQLHHVHCLEPEVREDLLAMVGLQRMPRHVYFGDGSPIDDEVMALLGRLYEECAVRFDWQRGDVVMLDNLLAAHARDPYEGPRKIVVAMGDLHQPAQLLNNRSEMELQN